MIENFQCFLDIYLALIKKIRALSFLQFSLQFQKRVSFSMAQTKIKSLALSLLTSSLACYSPSNLFLSIRWVWGFWKWSQMISYGPKHGFSHQNQFSRRLRTKVKVSLLEVVLGLLQPLHPVPDLQVGLRLMKMVPNDFSWPKTWV